jgi:WD40 repeat protein/serine/threonine protein kinase
MNECDLFMAALQIEDATERSAYLDRACASETALRQRVEALLAAFEQAGSFLQQPAAYPRTTSDLSHRGPSSDSNPAEGLGTVIGPYKLLEPIGEGGMGTVWMAQQTEPVKRLVAVKLIKAGMDSRQVIARFEAERQALALMDHPNIAKVLDAGATGACRPYFVMDLVKGVPITRYCDEHHLTPRQRLELFVPVCQAVQHAHQKGIIHRDLKPSNVLVALYDGKPVPKVIDFGVAKAAGQSLTDKTLVTGFGTIVGTLEYMSPEQAEVNQLDIDTRSDVYSLGVLLYELLAGSPPFTRKELEKASMLEMLRVIREQEPSKPSTKLSTAEGLPTLAANRGTEPAKLIKLVRGELDWIVMKALEKDCNRRYQTANGLAMELHRYLNDEPVLACPPSAVYQFRKFVWRNKAALVTASVVALAVLLAIIALAVSNVQIAQETHQKEAALGQANTARGVAERQRDAALQNLYFAHMQLAHQDWHSGHTGRMHSLLEAHLPRSGEPDLRGWEWYYLLSLCHRDRLTFRGHAAEVRSVCSSPDGQRIASGSGDHTIRLWDAKTGREIGALYGHEKAVLSLSWGPDGKRLAGGDDQGKVIVWDTETSLKLKVLDFGQSVYAVAWGPDGQRIAAGGRGKGLPRDGDGAVAIWDANSGKKLHTLIGHVGMIRSLAWSPDGRYLVAGENWRGKIQVWDAAPGQLVQTLDAHGHYIGAVAWSPDGRQFASASLDQTIKFWEVKTWKNLRVIAAAHRGVVQAVSWSADGKQLASAGEDGLVKIWDVSSGQGVALLRGHTGPVASVCWRRDDRNLVSGSKDGTVKLWDLSIEPAFRTLAGGQRIAWSPDGRLLAARVRDLPDKAVSVGVFEAATGRRIFSLPYGGHELYFALAWSPDGQRLAGALGNMGKVVVWDLSTRQEILGVVAHRQEARSVAWSPDSRLLASAGEDGLVHLWNMDAKRPIFTFREHPVAVGSVLWSPDGKRIASMDLCGNVKIWAPKTGHVFLDLRRPVQSRGAHGHYGFSWSPRGNRLAAAGYGGEIIVWDASSGREILFIRGHTSLVRTVAWSPDGKRLASAGYDRGVKIWDAETGRELLSLPEHSRYVGSITWSPDGQQLATAAGPEGRIWDASLGYRLAREEEKKKSGP